MLRPDDVSRLRDARGGTNDGGRGAKPDVVVARRASEERTWSFISATGRSGGGHATDEAGGVLRFVKAGEIPDVRCASPADSDDVSFIFSNNFVDERSVTWNVGW